MNRHGFIVAAAEVAVGLRRNAGYEWGVDGVAEAEKVLSREKVTAYLLDIYQCVSLTHIASKIYALYKKAGDTSALIVCFLSFT